MEEVIYFTDKVWPYFQGLFERSYFLIGSEQCKLEIASNKKTLENKFESFYEIYMLYTLESVRCQKRFATSNLSMSLKF
jgi:hypothetical protein